MRIEELPLKGARLIYPDIFSDERGFFFESYHEPRYREAGVACAFVQDNHARSILGAVRGLHFQRGPGQAKLLRVTSGRIFDVIVDIRPDSPTFGKWHGAYLDATEHRQLFIPVGFAHGYCTVSDIAEVHYKVSAVYDKDLERAIRWDDPEIGIAWPVANAIVSARDATAPTMGQLHEQLA